MFKTAEKMDFFKTFYATDHGRMVLAAMDGYVRNLVVTTPEMAVGKCMLMDFVDNIKIASGLKYGLEMITAESTVAAQNQEEEKPVQKKGILDL